MTIRFGLILAFVLTLSGCGGKSFKDFTVSFGFVSPYDVAVNDYKKGKMLEARERLLSIPKEHNDYKKAKDFLNEKVEPARLKLLRYYVRKGKKEEKLKHWAQAADAFKTAAGLSTRPQVLIDYQNTNSLKARKLRAQTLYEQLKTEDSAWLSWKGNYIPPSGLLGNDEAYLIARESFEKSMEARLQKTWQLATKYKQMDMPELAWIYADSYLRFNSRSKDAQDLKNAMNTAIPDVVRIHQSEKKSIKKTVRKSIEKDAKVSVDHVKLLMLKKNWLEAKSEARALRLQGDVNADKLLEVIQKNIEEVAQKAFQDGNLAFRLEKIDEAVGYWQKAVELMPNEQSYADSLRRGMQIQERLEALKSEDAPSDTDGIGE